MFVRVKMDHQQLALLALHSIILAFNQDVHVNMEEDRRVVLELRVKLVAVVRI
tara:strand:+ start:91 stop:249 length:159 start_codon:yes stop_codon:yes gene_type:complete